MKKTLVARCVTALIGGVALIGGAQAAVVGIAGGAPLAGAGPLGPLGVVNAATRLEVNNDGLGHILFVPYYSVAGDNNTLLNIVNTDRYNGKAVKVRFRGASNSDDVFDFTLLMSPGDVWSAAVSRGADGKAKLVTNDKSCTLPNVISGASFVTLRLDQSLSAADQAKQTTEGYVEILNMADIPPKVTFDAAVPATLDLHNSIKHVSGVPRNCASNAVNALFTDSTDYANAVTKGLEVPTTGLMANWTIINVPAASSWAGHAVAVEAREALPSELPGYGNIVLSPQAATAVTVANARLWTADPLLRGGVADNAGVAAANWTLGATSPVAASQYDFPDLSTPYLNGDLGLLPLGVATKNQASRLMQAMAVTSTTNEFITEAAILGKTDWVFSMPVRRYNVARDYTIVAPATTGTNVYTNLDVDDAGVDIAGVNWFTPANISTTAGVICVKGIATAAGASTPVPNNLTGAVTANQEESFVGSSTEFVISPGVPAAPLTFCGEVSVLSFNAAGQPSVLNGAITRKDLTLAYTAGWMRIATPGLGGGAGVGKGLPVTGQAFMQYSNGPISSNYGVNFPHRATRY